MIFLLISCSNSKVTTADVFQKGLDEKKEHHSYYMEVKMVTKEPKKKEEYTIKSWYEKDTHKNRMEVYQKGKKDSVYIFDGETTYYYDVKSKEVLTISGADFMQESDAFFAQRAMDTLVTLQKTHKINILGEEKVAKRQTYKIKAEPKKEGTLYQEQQLWIDQKTWLPLKLEASMGDINVKYEVTMIDYSPKFNEKLFVLKVPKDVVFKKLEDTMSYQDVTLEEAKKAIGHPFLYLPNEASISMEKVEKFAMTIDGEKITEISIYYFKNNAPYFTMTFFEKTEELGEPLGLKEVTVRGKEGEMMDDQIRNLSWVEEELVYSIDFEDESLTLEDMLTLSERFVFYE